MSFLEIINQHDPAQVCAQIDAMAADDVKRALSATHLEERHLMALLSPVARGFLEPMAQRSAAITRQRFGKVIQLYAPLYLSNECVNKCTYCGFSHDLDIHRITLTPEQVLRDAEILRKQGFQHILLVSGEDKRYVSMPYLLEVVRVLNERFASIAIEIQPLTREEYAQLAEAGVDGLALYQEVYDREQYAKYHLAGPKKNYEKRVDAIAAGGEAGMHALGIGALLGLADWRYEVFMMLLHGRHLTRRFWQSRIGVSFPRIRDQAAHFMPSFPFTDHDFVQAICATRIALPDAELVLSTREPAALRDRLLPLGFTRISAGSSTTPGGYCSQEHDGEQFEISDARSPSEVARVIETMGLEPVWKDFDRGFVLSSA